MPEHFIGRQTELFQVTSFGGITEIGSYFSMDSLDIHLFSFKISCAFATASLGVKLGLLSL